MSERLEHCYKRVLVVTMIRERMNEAKLVDTDEATHGSASPVVSMITPSNLSIRL